MNSILFYPEEIADAESFEISRERAEYIYGVHSPPLDTPIRAIVLGLGRGEVVFSEASRAGVKGKIRYSKSSMKRMPLTLLCGIPRPQTVKKIIALGTTLGVKEIIFSATENGEKSYLQSKSLHPEFIQKERIKALEQACDPYPPIISVNKSFLHAFKSASDKADLIVCADMDSQFPISRSGITATQEILLCIGAEKGWSERERTLLTRHKAQFFTLGERMLRVETAATAAIAQIQLMQQTIVEHVTTMELSSGSSPDDIKS